MGCRLSSPRVGILNKCIVGFIWYLRDHFSRSDGIFRVRGARGRRTDERNMGWLDSTVLSSAVLGPIVVIIGVEFEVEFVREVSSGEGIVSLSG